MISSKPLDIPCSLQERKVLEKIALAAHELGVPAYLIGGFVRDKLLGRKTKDMDIVCVGDGIALAHKVAESLGNNIPVNFFKTYGTAQVKLNDLEIEFVGARKESYREESRNPEVSAGTLQDDQNRRDFTINAMAISLRDIDYGSLLDPFDGLADLDKKIIRTPLAPAQTFSDDPLRMMRGIRFASQLQFTIEEGTFTAIQENAERIRIISQERISDEFNKIMLSVKPSVGLDLLYKSGLLKIIFPQMIDMVGVEMYEGKGHKDNFYHTLQVVDNISENTKDLWLRWAALLHDIGKPATKKFEPGHGWTFHGHDAVGGKMVPRIFGKMKLPLSEKMRLVKKLVELHLRPISLTKENITDSAIRRLLFDAGDDIEGLMMLCEADITSKNKTKVKRYLENFELVRRRLKEVEESDRIRNWQPPITGEMIMETFGLKPGRIVGDLKSAIREAILDGEIPNTYEAAYAFLLEKAGALNLSPVK
ncbi:HDIG domain-containing protein [Chitinophaga ginsengisegetis]|uniref:HDIG domain-containing protein n=1 Tax=Chitinophaga ginsengisegetis TaxID=393003 RepID=A0A1T5NF31_9BACT|nr:HD domain-containing protein [Chitinophaga ginsengisegetis]MDR6570406.1 putative nucleotidyltransferase with HDIG domain [Chitinophaga ginsengisegetis]MDR6650140.1 putative nucleotidyltransferase with HDIG domain [Chitinophaga ginsengisegetis]MDR6656741.1 putative nucleotidyltransferase with HDIG domain [Chitinophaga ginsengisegetis]SKC98992.1 HDIG domain-containing protein [Chitinophaga ginsengisegetis]